MDRLERIKQMTQAQALSPHQQDCEGNYLRENTKVSELGQVEIDPLNGAPKPDASPSLDSRLPADDALRAAAPAWYQKVASTAAYNSPRREEKGLKKSTAKKLQAVKIT